MKHTLKLDQEYYEAVKNGIKTIELRLYDEKRRTMQVGDTLEFFKQPDLNESILTEITELIIGKSFDELLESYPIEMLAGSIVTKEELKTALNRFYSREQQEENGIVGIRVKLI